MTRDVVAETAIRETIAREGQITFRRFMEMALYSAPGSYYGSAGDRIGARGDYFTSPIVHPSFAALVARQVEQVWIALGRPDRFDLVEVGAGSGALARDLLDYTARWSPSFHQALAYTAADVRGGGSRAQRNDPLPLPLPPTGGKGRGWESEGKSPNILTSSDPLITLPEDSLEGCILSNELLDAFPVHRVAVVGGELKEVYVEVRDGALAESLGDPSSPRLASYFEQIGFLPPEGCRAEVNLAALDWMARAGRTLRRGIVLTLDYGYPAEELYSPRHRDGTLLCFYRHTLNDDPYARIGEQDMTAHIDFSSVQRAGLKHGLQPVGLTTQRSFLAALGMEAYLTALAGMGLRRQGYEANRQGILELLKPEGLGRIRVLLQQKRLEGFDPAGLRSEGLRIEELGRNLSVEPPPLLGRSHLRLTAPPEAEEMMDAEGMWRELFGDGES